MQFRKKLEEVESQREAEKEWWEKRRATIQSEFMKELDGDDSKTASTTTPASKPGSDDDAVLVKANGVAENEKPTGGKKKKGKK